MGEEAWLGLAQVDEASLDKKRALHLYLPAGSSSLSHAELTSTDVQVISTGGRQQRNPARLPPTVRLHPLLYEFLTLAAQKVVEPAVSLAAQQSQTDDDESVPVSLAPLPGFDLSVTTIDHRQFRARSIDGVRELPEGARVVLRCVHRYYDENATGAEEMERLVASALHGRWIQQGTTLILCLAAGLHVAVIVRDIQTVVESEEEPLNGSCYRVGRPDSYVLEMLSPAASQQEEQDASMEGMDHIPIELQTNTDCPGYETQVDHLVQLLQLPSSARPSGLLLTGCAGVGKTRLVQCVASQLLGKGWSIHRVSVHDLVLQASWATEERLLATLRPPLLENALLVIDDLDAAGNENDDSATSNDHERRLVRNSLLQVVDQMVQRDIPVLGIGTDVSQLPFELVKVGRLEKEVSMSPPSQRQREQILGGMLTQLVENDAARRIQWAELLATLTAGCVAADLRQLCAGAWNRSLARSNDDDDVLSAVNLQAEYRRSVSGVPSVTWEDLSEAARSCVPSQLAALDVTKPKSFLHVCSANDWARIHELSWNDFAGYAQMKKRLYRTVVVPWRRLLSNNSSPAERPNSIAPPSGVLFHGASGCGKTLAANCLGSSLGLPMIKVRAADVLDKWLGGSEATIRSLFSRARAAAPSILFFDEIDAIAGNRSEGGETTDVMSRLLSTLLNEMDGVSSGQASRVLVVACTNRLEALDAALLRPGRLEEHIPLEKPTLDDAQEMVCLCLSRAPLDTSLDLDSVAAVLVDKSASGAVIEGTCREAVFQALRGCSKDADAVNVCVTIDDISSAMTALKLL